MESCDIITKNSPRCNDRKRLVSISLPPPLTHRIYLCQGFVGEGFEPKSVQRYEQSVYFCSQFRCEDNEGLFTRAAIISGHEGTDVTGEKPAGKLHVYRVVSPSILPLCAAIMPDRVDKPLGTSEKTAMQKTYGL